ncbi:MAG: MarR family transcriptional regulator [Hydrogenophaga sp.]|uniref:MarR family winged helix-turn-helix transcriptional regulator n=1 Tax=Hydrogenophaga sp. TaxID=1904254 RepID=UPI001E163DF8|nr:MarR family transcriptional regulator [Hydrogenophaga sp.]MBX3608323.1 MarR family transcriptional regulator [Hydrogenophaga sp.]
MKSPPSATPDRAGPPPSFYRPDDYRPENSIGRLVRSLLVLMSTEVERGMAPLGLTDAQWLPLFKLHRAQASTSSEVARECRIDAGATTRLLDRLAEKGFVQRNRSAEDRRVVNLELTPEGAATAEQIPAVLCQVQNELLRGFTQDEVDTLKALLERMLDNGQALQDAAQAIPQDLKEGA